MTISTPTKFEPASFVEKLPDPCCIARCGAEPTADHARDERHRAGCEWLSLMKKAEGATDG